MDDLSLAHIFNMYRRHITPEGVKRQCIGRVMHDGVEPEVLADYFGLLHPLRDPTTADRVWRSLTNHAYFEAVPLDEIHNGHRPDLVPEVTDEGNPNGSDPEPTRPPSKFLYQHQGMDEPAEMEFIDGMARMNGSELSPEQFNRILENLNNGIASIRYNFKEATAPVLKMEPLFAELLKIEPHLVQALGKLRAAQQAGHIDKDTMQALTREIFGDPMVPGIGNKKAYEDFMSRPRTGVHVHMDGNDFGSINKAHGHDVGDHAIKAMGRAWREAMDESVGRHQGKVYRTGGDEARAFVPDQASAARFARTLRQKLDAIPPIGGTHKLSMSIGFGHTPDSAEHALIQAKTAKKNAGYQQGHAKNHVHSMVPGFEGPVPVESSVPKIALPPAEMRPGGAVAPSRPTVPPAPGMKGHAVAQ
jgi:GGDEF domain-containing protein